MPIPHAAICVTCKKAFMEGDCITFPRECYECKNKRKGVRILMKLYRITLQGNFPAIGDPYVVAENSDLAYQKVKDFLDKKDYGFSHERELDKIELIAEACDYPKCKTILLFSENLVDENIRKKLSELDNGVAQ